MAVTDTFDLDALRAGGLVAAAVAVPAGLIAQAIDDDDSGWVALLAVVVLAGLVAGAVVAARRQRRGLPLTHAMVTAVGVFVVVQAIGIIRRSVAGDDVTWSRVASSFLLSLMAGVVGGLIASWRDRSGTRPG